MSQTTPHTRVRSAELFEEAKRCFPGGVNSPVRAFGAVGGTPLFVDRGEGAHIWDADGQRYIDFCCSWGPLILGHAHPVVQDRILRAVKDGTSFGTPTRLENELGSMILENHPYAERIRFVSSGTEAAMSAIRLARGVTGKNKILKFDGCYHGHVDALLVKAGSGLATLGTSTSAGVPEAYARETLVLPLNDLEALEATMKEHGDDLAVVAIEPIPANNGLLIQDPSFLQGVRDLCDKYGVLLLFDEVISGFRVAFGARRSTTASARCDGLRQDHRRRNAGGGLCRFRGESWTMWRRWGPSTRRARSVEIRWPWPRVPVNCPCVSSPVSTRTRSAAPAG